VTAGVAVTAGVVQRAACALRACTSTMCGPHAVLCGWLLPGPYSVAFPNPACVAICPAVWPLPYSFVMLDEAGAVVLWPRVTLVVLDGLTPAVGLDAVGLDATDARTFARAAARARPVVFEDDVARPCVLAVAATRPFACAFPFARAGALLEALAAAEPVACC
jgi:hypothetical protein